MLSPSLPQDKAILQHKVGQEDVRSLQVLDERKTSHFILYSEDSPKGSFLPETGNLESSILLSTWPPTGKKNQRQEYQV